MGGWSRSMLTARAGSGSGLGRRLRGFALTRLSRWRGRKRHAFGYFLAIEIVNDVADVVPGFAIRRNAVVLLHAMRARVVGSERLAQVVVVLDEQLLQVAG